MRVVFRIGSSHSGWNSANSADVVAYGYSADGFAGINDLAVVAGSNLVKLLTADLAHGPSSTVAVRRGRGPDGRQG